MKSKKDILEKVLWFDKNICDANLFAELEPKRKVSEHYRYKNGNYFSEKCKKVIQHESELELKFFEKLEKMKKVLFYWEQPIQASYWRGKRKSHTTPDAGIILDNLKVIIVEVKPLSGMLDYKVQLKVEGLLKFCAETGCGFLLTDGKDTLDKIRKVKCNLKLEKAILKSIDNSVLYKRECNEILKKCNASQNELLKIIFKHNLKYRSFPFKLQTSPYKNDLFHQVFYEKKRYDDLVKERFSTLFK